MTSTTIILKKTTRDSLKQVGKKGQSYDELICDLIQECRRKEGRSTDPIKQRSAGGSIR
jgi:hypothetical protein